MISNKKILCLIPARSGSKGIPNKNIKKFKGLPLMSWSIKQAKESKYAKNIRINVSTDSEEYIKIPKEYGAEVPFLRPKSLSDDLSTDFEFINHAVNWLKNNEKYMPDIILQLRPTQPCRKVGDIDECIDIFLNNYEKYDSLRTVVPFEKSPYKMYSVDSTNSFLIPLFYKVENIKEPYKFTPE